MNFYFFKDILNMLEQLANINQIIKIVFLFLAIINVKANHYRNKQSNDVKYQIKWVYDGESVYSFRHQ